MLKDLVVMRRRSDSQSDIDAQQRVSRLVDQIQVLQRQLQYAQQQRTSFAEASIRARARSKYLAEAVVAAEDQAKWAAAKTAHVQAR